MFDFAFDGMEWTNDKGGMPSILFCAPSSFEVMTVSDKRGTLRGTPQTLAKQHHSLETRVRD